MRQFTLFTAFLIAFLMVGRSAAQNVRIEVMDPPFQLERDTSFVVNVPVRIVSGTPNGRTFTVNYTTEDGGAQAGSDYVMTSGTLTFNDLDTELEISVTILADNEQEMLECFIVDIFPFPANQAGLEIDNNEQAAICIADNDGTPTTMTPTSPTTPPPPPPSIAPQLPSPILVNEGDGIVRICVQANNVVTSFNVNYITSDGSAIAPDDYSTSAGNLTFSSSSLACVDIMINNDNSVEPTECFNFILTAPAGVNNPQSTTLVCILDNDVADNGRVGFQRNIYTVDENVVTPIPPNFDDVCIQLFDVTLVGAETVSTMVSFTQGTATDGVDYIPDNNPQVLLFDSSNQGQALCVPINIINDLVDEPNESFFASLTLSGSNVSPPVSVSPNRTEIIIIDDDDATPTPTPTVEPDMMGPGIGDDPHFAIFLPSGKLLCYTVQGEHSFVFNLISNEKMHMNALFVPDSRREEVTWIGALGIVVQDTYFQGSNITKIQFKSKLNEIDINDRVTLQAKNIESITFRNGKLLISEGEMSEEFRYPSVRVNLDDMKMSFTVNFTGEHLDMMWNRLDENEKSHGLIGQFFRKGVEIDVAKKLLLLPGKQPVPVMRKPVWAYMEHNVRSDQLCWVAMNPGYQGNRLIDGHYLDYVVDNILSTDFKFECKHKHLKQYGN